MGLRRRDATGQGCHLDIAMADAMFTFAWQALAVGHATGRFPAAGELMLAGGSPRYQLYRTKDDKLVACAALEQKFWLAFVTAIGLAPDLANDLIDPAATRKAVAAIVAVETADHWAPLFATADCCTTIVASLEEALADPHFVARGLFAHTVAGETGRTMPALPLPVAAVFRQPPGPKPAPRLGADNDEVPRSPDGA
jgi:crotonobetainyl-CoA:carnitine CoA-transferase CaiB-like acyl-CoA transferase